MKFAAPVFLTLCFPCAAYASDACIDKLRDFADESRGVANKDTFDSAVNSFCFEHKDNKNDSQASQASASYKVLSGSYGQSSASVSELYTAYCSNTQTTSANRSYTQDYSIKYGPQATKLLETCELFKEDSELKLERLSIQPTDIAIHIMFEPKYNHAPTADITYSLVGGGEGAHCWWKEPATEEEHITLPYNHKATLRCHREHKEEGASIDIARTDDGEGSRTIPFEWLPVVPPSPVPVPDQRQYGTIYLPADGETDRGSDTATSKPYHKDCWPGDAFIGKNHFYQAFDKPFKKAPKVTFHNMHVEKLRPSGLPNAPEMKMINENPDPKDVDEKGFYFSFGTFCQYTFDNASVEWTATPSE